MSRKDDISKLIKTYSRRLQKLKEQQALEGRKTDPAILIEIEDIEVEIRRLQEELATEELRDQVRQPGEGYRPIRESGGYIKLTEKGNSPNPISFETIHRLITIGRDPEKDVVLEDPKASWHHGYIVRASNHFRYHHSSDSNPTVIRRYSKEYLLKKGIQSDISLQNNDRIVIGDTTLVVELDTAPGSSGYITTQQDERYD